MNSSNLPSDMCFLTPHPHIICQVQPEGKTAGVYRVYTRRGNCPAAFVDGPNSTVLVPGGTPGPYTYTYTVSHEDDFWLMNPDNCEFVSILGH
jgi:hypothetical protein